MDISSLNEIAKTAQTWSVPSIVLNLCRNRDAEPSPIDIVKEKPSGKSKYRHLDKSDLLWFPKQFDKDDKDTRKKICKLLNNSLKDHQTKVIISRTVPRTAKDGSATRRIFFQCPRSKKSTQPSYDSCTNQNGDKRRQTISLRTKSNNELCRFCICISCYTPPRPSCQGIQDLDNANGSSRYFLNLNDGVQSFSHNDHPRPEIITQRRDNLSEDVLHLLSCMLLKHSPAPIAQCLITEMTGMNVDTKTLQNLKNKLMNEKFCTKDSTGQELLNLLEGTPKLNYAYFTASRQCSEKLLTVKKRRKHSNPTAPAENTETYRYTQDSSRTEVHIDANEQKKMDLSNLVEKLKLSNEQEVLVAVAWMSESQRRYFEMYPSFIGFDITHNTNAEKRPMFVLVGRTANGENIPLLNAFFPSEAKWTFSWVFEEAIPYLVGEEVLKGIRLAIQDEDKQCMSAFSTAKIKLYPNSELRLCKWHKVNRNYSIKATTNNFAETRFRDNVVRWLYFFCHSIETEKEETHSKDLLLKYIVESHENGTICESLRVQTELYVRNQFFPNLPYLCFRNYKRLPGGDKADNCVTESENASLKCSVTGPKPCNKLPVAASATIQHVDSRIKKKRQNIDRAVISSQPDYVGEDSQESIRNSLADRIADRPLREAAKQYDLSQNYVFMECPKGEDSTQSFLCRSNLLPCREAGDPLPSYCRTRKVSMQKAKKDGYIVIKCSCCYHERNLRPCRHIYNLLGRHPKIEDFHPTHLLSYEKYCHCCDEFLEECKRQMNEIEASGGFLIQESFPFSVPDHVKHSHECDNRKYFEAALDEPLDTSSMQVLTFDSELWSTQGEDDTDHASFSADIEIDMSNIQYFDSDVERAKSASFQMVNEKMKSIFKLCTTDSERYEFYQLLSEIEASKRASNIPKNGNSHQMVSFGNLDRSRESKRIRGPGSPNRTGRKKKTSVGL